jgi:Magnesium chelatase, subunit ChlI C-terminal
VVACARGRVGDVRTNAQVSGPVLEEIARADSACMALLRDAADSMRLTARGYHRILRVAHSPTLTEPSASDACISRKPCLIGHSPTMCAERRDLLHGRYRLYLALTKAIETWEWTAA